MSDNKVLIIGPAWVGDMVMAQSLFKLLKARQPDLIIEVLAPSFTKPLLERMPEISESLIQPLGHGKLQILERRRMGMALRLKKYQQAIVLPNSFKSALIPWFASIPIRTGWRGEMRYGLLNDVRVLDWKRYPLMIEQFMALGLPKEAPLPVDYPLPQLRVSEKNAAKTLSQYQLNTQSPVLIICPGAEFGPAKRWPEEYYAEVANKKINAGWQVWILGSAKDLSVAKKISELTQHRCINLASKTTLEEAIDLISKAKQVVCNDSGLMHIAAALNKPIIAVYGPTSAQFTPPLSDSAKVLSLKLNCQPCFKRTCPLTHHRCMKELSPQTILDAMEF